MDKSVFYKVTVTGDITNTKVVKVGDATITKQEKTDRKLEPVDITEDINSEVVFTEEDGKIRSVSFSINNGFKWLDVLSIGMVVELIGGTLERSESLFYGNISTIQPSFTESGAVDLHIACLGKEWKASALEQSDLVFPSNNCPYEWGKVKELTGKELLTNLAKECGFKIGGVNIRKEVKYTLKSPFRQNKITKWRAISMLCSKLSTIFWVVPKDSELEFYCEDESTLVNTVGNITFFFPLRNGDDFIVKQTSDKQIQFDSVEVNLDTNSAGANNGFDLKTDPETGEGVLGKDEKDPKTGEWASYVLDEKKLEDLSNEEQNALLSLIYHGQAGWAEVKQYFKKVEINEVSSREPLSEKTNVVDLIGDPKKDGVSTTQTTQHTSAPNNTPDSRRWKINLKKIEALPDLRKNEILGKYIRNEFTGDEAIQFFDPINVQEKKEDTGHEDSGKNSVNSNENAKRKDAGFNITAVCDGSLDVKTKLSYLIEGLGKYSGVYYLYEKKYIFGSRGFKMRLTFTK